MDAVAYRAWAVGSQGLGATFDADETQVTFRVYSSSATRIEVWLYYQRPALRRRLASPWMSTRRPVFGQRPSRQPTWQLKASQEPFIMTTALGGRIGLSTRRGNRVARPVSLKMWTMPETALIQIRRCLILMPWKSAMTQRLRNSRPTKFTAPAPRSAP